MKLFCTAQSIVLEKFCPEILALLSSNVEENHCAKRKHLVKGSNLWDCKQLKHIHVI